MKKLFCLLGCTLLLACGSGDQDATSEMKSGADTQVAMQETTVEHAVHNVSCGCVLEGIGHCGNYVEIDSRYVEIANGDEFGLGRMEWCGQSGVKAELAGAVKDGKLVATTLVVQ